MSRLEKIKADNPELNVSIIDIICAADPSNTYKYCDFLLRMVKQKNLSREDVIKLVVEKLIGMKNVEQLNYFEDHSKANRIPLEHRDISSHKSWSSIQKVVEDCDQIIKMKELEKKCNKLYDDGEWLVLIPQTYEASMLYAKGTKWCITQKSYWDDYKKHSRIIFVINRKTDDKFAISKRFDGQLVQGWDAKDIETSPLMWEFNDEVWKIIRTELRKTKTESDIESLTPGNILTQQGKEIQLESATLNQIESFYKKYGKLLNEPFLSEVIQRGKVLREAAPKIEKYTDSYSSPSFDIYKKYVEYDTGNGPQTLEIDDYLKLFSKTFKI